MWELHIELDEFEIADGITLAEKIEYLRDSHDAGECEPMLCPVCFYENMPYEEWEAI